jgi:hypothetical protein
MTEPMAERWITTKQGRTLTGYSQAYVRQIARDDRITARKMGRDWLINRESLLACQATIRNGHRRQLEMPMPKPTPPCPGRCQNHRAECLSGGQPLRHESS